jgi:hypothetical protein
MKLLTWDDILNIDEKSIKLIWYWSLLNENTHHEKHNYKAVIFYWFKRVYNLKIINDFINKKSVSYLWQYWITCEEKIKSLINNNICALNCVCTWNTSEIVNWLCLEIEKNDLLDYSIREKQYNLVETKYDYVCPKTWKIEKTSEIAYVLVAKDEEIIANWIPFDKYHSNTRNWAYKLWEYFWKMFDETTYNVLWELVKK